MPTHIETQRRTKEDSRDAKKNNRRQLSENCLIKRTEQSKPSMPTTKHRTLTIMQGIHGTVHSTWDSSSPSSHYSEQKYEIRESSLLWTRSHHREMVWWSVRHSLRKQKGSYPALEEVIREQGKKSNIPLSQLVWTILGYSYLDAAKKRDEKLTTSTTHESVKDIKEQMKQRMWYAVLRMHSQYTS